MNKPQLHAVSAAEQDGSVDSWQMPTDLPPDIAIFPRRFLGERFWKFDPQSTLLIPASTLKIEELLIDYIEYPVFVHNHRRAMIENQTDIPEEYRPYSIYFLSDVYLRCKEGATRFVYCIKYEQDRWVEEEVRFESIPLRGKGRIIMMR